MRTRPLIEAQELADLMAGGAGKVLICDCSFDLANPAAGEAIYRQGHIPNAQYVNLDTDLSSAKNGHNGRHPLPDAAHFVQRMKALGANNDTLIVAYDNAAGMYAARLWWLLGSVGHERRAVLNGGFASWKASGLPVQADGIEGAQTAGVGGAQADSMCGVKEGSVSARPSLVNLVDRQFVLANIDTQQRLVIDARKAERFRGENETMDAKAGHIPKAKNRFFQQNLGTDGRFKPVPQLLQEFGALLVNRPAEQIVHQCGSGVTACHNVLAMEAAGLYGSALYAGSWSEWSQHEGMPVVVGAA
ncbi:sulfurtransferase [Alcaligenaceae bacterium]|nr:sulfurtransferase [Alcaligenaceae bacterium]